MMVNRLREAQLYGDGGFGHADVVLSDGSTHRVIISGKHPDFTLTPLTGETIPVDDIIEVTYDDVNGH